MADETVKADMHRPPVSDVSGERLMTTMKGIAQWVRLSGTDDEMEAVRYVERLLQEAGLDTEVLQHDALISLPGPASVRIVGADAELVAITHSMATSTPPEGIEADLVYVSSGLADAYEGGAAHGKIALVDGLGNPGKVHAAEDAGALAMIFINDRYTHEMIVSDVWGSPAPHLQKQLPRIPVLSVNEDVGSRLKAALQEGHTRVVVKAMVDTRWRKTPILTAELGGREDDFVLFSGHIDSWHFGAMDNGTANATMVEVARLMAAQKPLRRGLRLCFWSGHSHGRYSGSAWYVDHHWEDLHDHCVAHVNIDSVGGKGASVLSEGMASEEMRPIAAEAIELVAGVGYEGSRVGRSGDQSFVGVGLPSLFMSVSEQPLTDDPVSRGFNLLMGGAGKTGGLGWWWHTTEDLPDKIDEALLVRDCQIYAAAIYNLLTMPLLAYDYSKTAAAIAAEIHHLQELSRGKLELAEPLERAQMLEHKARHVYQMACADAVPADKRAAFNDAVKALGRRLVPIWQTKAGPFGHDPAHAMPKLPLLADAVALQGLDPMSPEAHMLRVELARGRNEVSFALREALKAADAAAACGL